MTAKDVLSKIEEGSSWVLSYDIIDEVIIPAMEEYGKQQYNQAIDDAAENAKVIRIKSDKSDLSYHSVDKQSILKLKK